MQAVGEQLGRACQGGEVFLLSGSLGSGKTCFTQGLARGLGVPEGERVTSPTFILHSQYEGRLLLNHIDAYRLSDSHQPDPGLDEIFGQPGTVCAVEWSEYLPYLPHDHLGIHLTITGITTRQIRFTPVGALHTHLLERVMAFLPAEIEKIGLGHP